MLEFSDLKEKAFARGVLRLFADLTKSPNKNLRLNAVWALKNLIYSAEMSVRPIDGEKPSRSH